MKLNPKGLLLTVCLGAALAVTGLTGCQTHGDRSEGRYKDDKKIASNVKKDLKDAPVYKFPDVQVAAYDGVVQLSGFVDTEDQKNNASQIARHTDGVREVVNSLVIKPQVVMTGPAPVINNENRITTTGTPTGHRIEAQPSSTHYGGSAAGGTGPASGTTTITTTGPATTTTVPITPSETKATPETKTPAETKGPTENISTPSVNITTPNVNINTNAPSNP